VHNVYKLLKSMRGETSKPLVTELSRIIQVGVDAGSNLIAVQVESELVAKGLSLLLVRSEPFTAWVYLARNEIPGFISHTVADRLHQSGWNILDDRYGTEFAIVSKELFGTHPMDLATELAHGLEAVGAPQKYKWELRAEYF
jgi:hypothetical protein